LPKFIVVFRWLYIAIIPRRTLILEGQVEDIRAELDKMKEGNMLYLPQQTRDLDL